MVPVTLDLLMNAVARRRAAKSCSRCGGTGRFSTVTSFAEVSSYGKECFQCHEAHKLPRGWAALDVGDILKLFPNAMPSREREVVVTELFETQILSADRLTALRKAILAAGTS